jgi:Coenzyme PQQ synthesis protein D (PqqD)
MSQEPEQPRSVHTAEGGIVLDIRSGRMFSLNPAGSLIFQLLEQSVPNERIVEELVKRFDISIDVARADLNEFRKTLQQHALSAGGDSSGRNRS